MPGAAGEPLGVGRRLSSSRPRIRCPLPSKVTTALALVARTSCGRNGEGVHHGCVCDVAGRRRPHQRSNSGRLRLQRQHRIHPAGARSCNIHLLLPPSVPSRPPRAQGAVAQATGSKCSTRCRHAQIIDALRAQKQTCCVAGTLRKAHSSADKKSPRAALRSSLG